MQIEEDLLLSIKIKLLTANIIRLKLLSYIYDHLNNAIGSQKISCLCLLDPSAAFDTIGHLNSSFLLVRDSWLCFKLAQILPVISFLLC